MYEVRSEPHYLQVSITGEVDHYHLFQAQSALMLHPEYPRKNSLWVFDKEFVCGFSDIEMIEMIDRFKALFPAGATKEKCALLAANHFHYAFLKLLCQDGRNEGVPFEMKAFRNFQEACAWLMEKSEAPAENKRVTP